MLTCFRGTHSGFSVCLASAQGRPAVVCFPGRRATDERLQGPKDCRYVDLRRRKALGASSLGRGTALQTHHHRTSFSEPVCNSRGGQNLRWNRHPPATDAAPCLGPCTEVSGGCPVNWMKRAGGAAGTANKWRAPVCSRGSGSPPTGSTALAPLVSPKQQTIWWVRKAASGPTLQRIQTEPLL